MERELRVFSPSATESFGKCPRKWALNREGWKPRVVQYPELCAVLGDGFSASMHVLNTYRLQGVATLPMGEIVAAGTRTISERLAYDLECGRRIHEKDQEYADRLPLLLDRAVQLYLDANPLKDWTILASEQSYDAHGKARIDLLAADALGPAVFDYKVKVKLDKKWEDSTFEQYGRSQQRFHYQWCAGVKRFFIILVVLGPKPYVKVSPPYGESAYFDSGLWLQDAQASWGAMASILNAANEVPSVLAPGAPVHADQYGPCEYEDACLTHALDRSAMSMQYVQQPRRK